MVRTIRDLEFGVSIGMSEAVDTGECIVNMRDIHIHASDA